MTTTATDHRATCRRISVAWPGRPNTTQWIATCSCGWQAVSAVRPTNPQSHLDDVASGRYQPDATHRDTVSRTSTGSWEASCACGWADTVPTHPLARSAADQHIDSISH